MESEVAIVGAGPVGLMLASELAWRGVQSVIIDRGEDRRGRPRAKLTNVRSMEHLRRLGLAARLRDEAPLPAGYSTDVVFVTRLTGPLLTRFTNVFATDRSGSDLFPEPGQQVPQYVLEDVLRANVDTSPYVRRLVGVATSITEDDDDVTVTLEGGGSVTAQFAVGCDGGTSMVRRAIGGSMRGQAALTQNLTIVFSAPELHRLHPHGPALHYWLANPEVPGFMGPVDINGNWWLSLTGMPAVNDVEPLDPVGLVNQAVGLQLHPEILSVDRWQPHVLVADRVQRRHVLIAGDAAHLHPPFGAHGMNLGIGDAVDLGWKLAAILQGWAGKRMLDSYSTERGPLHDRVVAEAGHNNAHLANAFADPRVETDPWRRHEVGEAIQRAKHREFHSLGLVLGHSFGYSPIVVDGDGQPQQQPVSTYSPNWRPGSLLPHAWLSETVSSYDDLGPWFTLLVADDRGPDALGMIDRFESAARGLRVPLTVRRNHVTRETALVRPDRVIAWRADAGLAHLSDVLRTAIGDG